MSEREQCPDCGFSVTDEHGCCDWQLYHVPGDTECLIRQRGDEIALLRAERDALRDALRAAPSLWEADHQRAALAALGLADEFSYGCDSIAHVGEALLAARRQLAASAHPETARLRAVVERLESALLDVDAAHCALAAALAAAKEKP